MPIVTLPSIGVRSMAKKKVLPRPGALMEVLKTKGMTKVDAAAPNVTGIDRKTLGKINRGEEVKLETLQKLATGLRVPTARFLQTAEVDDVDDQSDPTHSVMLRKLNGERLAELLKDGGSIEWELNVQVVDEKARELLSDLERAVNSTQGALFWPNDLGEQLSRLKQFQKLSEILKELQGCRLALLGGDYVHWELSSGPYIRDPNKIFLVDYRSRRKILLSVESARTQSRRVSISPGDEPPNFAPNTSTIVRVDGRRLETANPPISNVDFDFRGGSNVKHKK